MSSASTTNSASVVGEEKKAPQSSSSADKPRALEHWKEIEQTLRGKPLTIFLDYDGTLTPIVDDPAEAKMTDEMREVVRQLARRHCTAIVTGRRSDTIRAFVQLEDLYYAASHGFEILGPGGQQVKQVAAQYLPALRDLHAALDARIKEAQAQGKFKGALLEDNIYCATLHYRNVAEEEVAALEALFDGLLAPHQGKLVKRVGKKVWEARPALDWDKGRAVSWLLENVFEPKLAQQSRGTPVLPLCFGDDMTDEDAFRAIAARTPGDTAFTFFVRGRAGTHRDTAATYVLDTVAEVQQFLKHLAEL